MEGGTKGLKEGRKRKKLGVRQRALLTTERPLEKRQLGADYTRHSLYDNLTSSAKSL